MKWIDQHLLADMLNQSKLHGSLLVAYDFDNTISPWGDKDDPAVLERSRELVRRAKAQGHIVYCYTANPNEALVHEFCALNDVPMDYLNESPPKGAGSKVPQGGGKCYYNIFLDDKCGLKSAQDTLEAFLEQTSAIEFDLLKAVQCHLGRLRAIRHCGIHTNGYNRLLKHITNFRKLAVGAHEMDSKELLRLEKEALK